MFIVQDKLISDDLIEEKFLCNLNACKGACCVEGDYGAPLDREELKTLETIYDVVAPFLTEAGKKAIAQQGHYVWVEEDQTHATPLLGDGACVYMTTDTLGIRRCGIEQAFRAGATDFYKPISCHLYPIRVEKNEKTGFEALNYDEWDICSAACTAGKKADLAVYKFVKDALVRKYGADFYDELDSLAQHIQSNK